MNILIPAEEAKHNAIYRLTNLALKAQRKGQHTRAKDLRNRATFLKKEVAA